MSYTLNGFFIEACDCTVICPCWVEDDPVGGHCTGLIAWHLDDGSAISGVSVGGRSVVSVSTHLGNRRDGNNTTTVLYVDEEATESQFNWLRQAFTGLLDGALADLSQVSGVVASVERAKISIELPDAAKPADGWTVLVSPLAPDGVHVVEATGAHQTFKGEIEPLSLTRTALSKELGVGMRPVVAQAGRFLSVNVGALPAGTLTVLGRSGMRGDFSYAYPEHVGGLDGRVEEVDAAEAEEQSPA